jgi:hypothetical protein
MEKSLQIPGNKFNFLTLIEPAEIGAKCIVKWLCRCDCGKVKIISARNIKSGHAKSCGCLQKSTVKKLATKHSYSRTKLYNAWISMNQRCNNPRNPNYKNYGGRGIFICEEWLDFEIFKNWSLENGYSEILSIDRINNNSGYNPKNCRWTDRKTQNNNTRRTILTEVNGEILTISQIAKKYSLKHKTISERYRHGHRQNNLIRPVGKPGQRFSKSTGDTDNG